MSDEPTILVESACHFINETLDMYRASTPNVGTLLAAYLASRVMVDLSVDMMEQHLAAEEIALNLDLLETLRAQMVGQLKAQMRSEVIEA